MGVAARGLAVEAELDVEIAQQLARDEERSVVHAEGTAHPVGLEHGFRVAPAQLKIVGLDAARSRLRVGELPVVLREGKLRAHDDPVAAGALEHARDGRRAGVAERRAGRAGHARARCAGHVGRGEVIEDRLAADVPDRGVVVGEKRPRHEAVDLAVLELDPDGGLAVGLPFRREVETILVVVAGGAPR